VRVPNDQRKATVANWGHAWDAGEVKAAVRRWAFGVGYEAVSEIEGIADGRLDLLLVPMSMDAPIFKKLIDQGHWTNRLGLVGVEIKISKADFQKGLSEQFERYGKSLSGLYIAGPPHIVVAAQVPRKFGVLAIGHGLHEQGWRVACRRHPEFKPCPASVQDLWRVMWKIKAIHQDRLRKIEEEKEEFLAEFREKAGKIIGRAVTEAMKKNGTGKT